jgi:hypothetical protein
MSVVLSHDLACEIISVSATSILCYQAMPPPPPQVAYILGLLEHRDQGFQSRPGYLCVHVVNM